MKTREYEIILTYKDGKVYVKRQSAKAVKEEELRGSIESIF